ncbi:MAG: hypothetical protein H6988_11450 [Pseudomonadales bacterium]|nr:hypothetical protein [Ardenticatenaceae bacterium]MCP5190991.1 hypothetical protein [Pseudomonadales bacterium]
MQKRGSIVGGLILILVGSVFLAMQVFPDLAARFDLARHWPLFFVGLGGLFLLGSLVGDRGMAVPGSVLAGLGGLFYYQNTTGDWGSWAYAWALIPGFVGVGTFLMHFLQGHLRRAVKEGGGLIFTSFVLFMVFGAFFGEWVSLRLAGPLLLIGLGVWLLLKMVVGGSRPGRGADKL